MRSARSLAAAAPDVPACVRAPAFSSLHRLLHHAIGRLLALHRGAALAFTHGLGTDRQVRRAATVRRRC